MRGPFQIAQLKQLAASGEITEADSIRKGDDGQWMPTPKVRGLFDKVADPSAATEEASGDADSISTAAVGRRKRRKVKSHASEPGKLRGQLGEVVAQCATGRSISRRPDRVRLSAATR